ncbi:MAG: SRPBCC family protein [Gemmatimonadota bacterium]|nr:SRPBCC family protein [Gemmatimonadota bacterium]
MTPTIRVEEMTTVKASAQSARRTLTDPDRMARWVAPNVTVRPHSASSSLAPGDRFLLDAFGAPDFDYLVEAVTDREVLFSFSGPWSGRERWSFIADGAETIVRRTYEVEESESLAGLAFRTVGRALVSAHFKLELSRFRAVAEANSRPPSQIEPPSSTRSFPIDDG